MVSGLFVLSGVYKQVGTESWEKKLKTARYPDRETIAQLFSSFDGMVCNWLMAWGSNALSVMGIDADGCYYVQYANGTGI